MGFLVPLTQPLLILLSSSLHVSFLIVPLWQKDSCPCCLVECWLSGFLVGSLNSSFTFHALLLPFRAVRPTPGWDPQPSWSDNFQCPPSTRLASRTTVTTVFCLLFLLCSFFFSQICCCCSNALLTESLCYALAALKVNSPLVPAVLPAFASATKLSWQNGIELDNFPFSWMVIFPSRCFSCCESNNF